MKKNLLKYALAVLGFTLSTGTVAHALMLYGNKGSGPEIDPSLAIGGLTLLAGTIAVLRIRRNK